MKRKPKMWWRRTRKVQSPIWHFMNNCPSLSGDWAVTIFTEKNPRSGTKCDHCQRLQKKLKNSG